MSPTEHNKTENAKSRKDRTPVLIVLGLVCTIALSYWIYLRSTHVYTDDSRVATSLVVLSSKVAGRIENFPISEGDMLKSGDLILKLDSAETELRVKELSAQLSAVGSEVAQSEAELSMVEHQTSGQLQAAKSQLQSAQATLASTESDLTFKAAEWKRAQSLREKKIISQQGAENAHNSYQMAKQKQQKAIADVASAEARLVEAHADRDRLRVLEISIEKLRHDQSRVALELQRQQVIVDERTIYSPQKGVVDQTFVHQGEYLMPGQRIALIHDPDNVWIKANIKETEIRHLKLGQPVEITVDAYPGETFMGEVVRIGNAATSQFSLLPNTNPSGNFTKITQRLPVKISVRQHENLLRPGMMVGIAIDIR
jgi:membrane fusion protein, multidrug efflux system